MRSFFWVSVFFCVCVLSLSAAARTAQNRGQAAPVKPSPMPADRAQATFEDKRVKTFMSAVAQNFGGKCNLPNYAKTEAKLTQRGFGDFSSSIYELTVPCPGNDGLAEVQITVEFSPPAGIVDLVLSLHYK
jgi:hypothetical protein